MAHQQIRFTVILKILSGLAVLSLLSACATVGAAPVFVVSQQPLVEETPTIVLPTPMPTRPPYVPGTLVDYTAQTGDTLPALASHFNTTESEIRAANPIIPEQGDHPPRRVADENPDWPPIVLGRPDTYSPTANLPMVPRPLRL